MLVRYLAIGFGSAFVLGLLIIFIAFGGGPETPYEPADLNRAPAGPGPDVFREVEIDIRPDVAERFPGASPRIQRIASAISDGTVPLAAYRDALNALTPGEIAASYETPHPEYPEYRHTLLREAVMAGNTGVAAILVERGADVTYNDHEMAFQAVTRVPDSQGWSLQFPDLEVAGKLLQLWADRVSDVDVAHPLYSQGTLLMNTPVYNLEAVLILLEAGADPWSPFPITAPDGGLLYELDPFFVSILGKSQVMSEVAFRAARAGYFDSPPDGGAARIRTALDSAARGFDRPSTDRDHAQVWAFQRAAEEIVTALDITPGPALKELLDRRVPSEIGGFYLAPGEIRSPYEADQRTSSDTPFGRERWPDS